MDEKIRASLLTQHLGPNKNNTLFSKETLEKAINDFKFKELVGIPVTINETNNINGFVDPNKIIGIATDFDLDNQTYSIKLNDSSTLTEFIKSTSASVEIRGIGHIDKEEFIIDKIINFSKFHLKEE